MYDDTAAYEGFMGRWSARLAPLMIDFAEIGGAAGRILDVGAGTGALAFALAERFPGSDIVAVDPSQGFVADARGKIGERRVRFDVGQAEALPYEEGEFDATIAMLVLQAVADAPKAVAEMIRVTRPDGRIAAAVWDFRGGMEMLAAFWREAREVDPEARERGGLPPYFASHQAFADLLRAAGLDQVTPEALTLELPFQSFDDFWLPFLAGGSRTAAYAAGLPPEMREAIRARLWRRLVGDRGDGPFTLTARAWALKGRAPG